MGDDLPTIHSDPKDSLWGTNRTPRHQHSQGIPVTIGTLDSPALYPLVYSDYKATDLHKGFQ